MATSKNLRLLSIGMVLGLATLISVAAPSVADAQQSGFVNASGRAWRKGTAAEADMVQLVVDSFQKTTGNSATFAGKISIKTANIWLPENEPINGTCEMYGDNLTFRSTVQTGGGNVTVRGFYSTGADEYSADDDQVYVYYFDDIGPETDPCDPEEELLDSDIEIPTP